MRRAGVSAKTMASTTSVVVCGAVPCLQQAWALHAAALHGWLRHHLGDEVQAEDLLQDVFIKAMRQGRNFCALENARAWLFEVTRNALADHLRRQRESVPLPEDLCAGEETPAMVDALSACLPRVISELSADDRDAITCCDLQGMSQADYAARLGISLSGAKSRVQRARVRLKAQLACACKVQLDEAGRVCCFTPRPPLGPSRPTED